MAKRPSLEDRNGLLARAEADPTPFGRALASALRSPLHRLSATSTVIGPSRLRNDRLLQGRHDRHVAEREGFTASPGALELSHVHGRLIPSLRRERRLDRAAALAPLREGKAAAELHDVPASAGGPGWTRACVDSETDPGSLLRTSYAHIDVALVPASGPGSAATVLPGGMTGELVDAVAAVPPVPGAAGPRVVRVLLLGDDRAIVTTGGDRSIAVEGLPGGVLGSLLVVDGELSGAELWLAERPLILAGAVRGAIEAFTR